MFGLSNPIENERTVYQAANPDIVEKVVYKTNPINWLLVALSGVLTLIVLALFVTRASAMTFTGTPQEVRQFFQLQNTADVFGEIYNPTDPGSFNLDDIGDVAITSATYGDLLLWSGSNWINNATSTSGLGTVTSVGLSVPTGLTVANSPVTTANTLAVTFTAGYSIPTTASQLSWDNKWDLASTTIGAIYGGTSQSTYAAGDMLYASAIDTLSKLTAGASSTVMTINVSGLPVWTNAPSVSSLVVSSLGTPAGTFLAVNPNGLVIATSTPGSVTSIATTWPIIGGTITTTGTLSFGGLGTSTDAVIGNIPYFSGVNTFANVATTTPTFGLGLTGGGTWSVLGSAPTLNVATSTFYSGATGQFPYFSGTNTLTATSSLFMSAGGNVGIGDTSPDQLLDIEGSTAGTNYGAFITNTDNTNGASHARVGIFTGGANGGDPHVQWGNNVVNWYAGIDNSDSDTFIISDSQWGTDFAITTGGNVGIGTTTPWGLLAVEQGTETNSFVASNTGSSTPSLVVRGVNGNGNVGIKVLNPATDLEVGGTASTTILIVSNSITIPQNLTVTSNGTLTSDNTTGQFRYYAAGAQQTVLPFTTMVAGYATSTWNGTTTIYMGPVAVAGTAESMRCETNAGTVYASLYDGTNRADIVSASTTIGLFTFGTNNTFTAGESMRMDYGTPATSPRNATCRVKYVPTAD